MTDWFRKMGISSYLSTKCGLFIQCHFSLKIVSVLGGKTMCSVCITAMCPRNRDLLSSTLSRYSWPFKFWNRKKGIELVPGNYPFFSYYFPNISHQNIIHICVSVHLIIRLEAVSMDYTLWTITNLL